MSEKRDGGPAFPSPTANTIQNGQLSVRDYFVVHAPAVEIEAITPASIRDCATFLGIPEAEYIPRDGWLRVLAKARGMWADAMLAEREKAS